MNDSIVIKELVSPEEKSNTCETILRALPDWFGIESAILKYINDVKSMTTFAAVQDNQTIGFLSVNRHNQWVAEIHVMGVLLDFHRKGVGRKLVEHVEKELNRANYKFLQVKTLSESRPCKEYDKTRNFYLAMDFIPVEEFKTLWGESNPCLLLIKNLTSTTPTGLHHLDINVSNLKRSMDFWAELLVDLGYTKFNDWPSGVSWKYGDFCFHFVQVEEKYLSHQYHRKGAGLNHIAFYARSCEHVNELTKTLKAKGVQVLYEDRHPFAGGPDHYAVFFEDPDRIKVEIAAP